MGIGGGGATTDQLFAGALAEVAAADEDAAVPCLVALHHRPTRDVFDRAADLLAREDPVERELGARVLRELGRDDGEGCRPFSAETVDVIEAAMGEEPDPWVLSWMISVLGYHHARRSLDLVLGHRAHPAQPVRFAIAAALPGLGDPERTQRQVLDALLRLAVDDSDAVRWYALYALFNETGGVAAEQRETWAACLIARAGADTRRRAQLSDLAESLDDHAGTAALRNILTRRS